MKKVQNQQDLYTVRSTPKNVEPLPFSLCHAYVWHRTDLAFKQALIFKRQLRRILDSKGIQFPEDVYLGISTANLGQVLTMHLKDYKELPYRIITQGYDDLMKIIHQSIPDDWDETALNQLSQIE